MFADLGPDEFLNCIQAPLKQAAVATTWPWKGEVAQFVVGATGTVPPRRTALEI